MAQIFVGLDNIHINDSSQLNYTSDGTPDNDTGDSDPPGFSDDSTFHNYMDTLQEQYFKYIFIPSGVLIIVFVLINQLKKNGRKDLFNRMAMIWPVDILDRQNYRTAYVAAFNVSAWCIFDLLMGDSSLSIYTPIQELNSLMKLIACLLLAIIFYPIFLAIASDNVVGEIIGLLYLLNIIIFYGYTNSPDPYDDNVLDKVLTSLQFIPCLAWMLILLIFFPYKIIRRFIAKRSHFTLKKKVPKNETTFEYEYVHRLMNYPDETAVPYRESIGKKGTLVEKVSKIVFKYIYTPIRGFKYSIGVLTAFSVSALMMWNICMTLILFYDVLYAFVETMAKDLTKKDSTDGDGSIYSGGMEFIQYMITQPSSENGTDYLLTRDAWVKTVAAYLNGVYYSLHISLCCAFLLSIYSMACSFINYRRHLLQLYRGDYSELPCLKLTAPRNIVVKSAKYVGYQFAYALWGFVIVAIVLLLIFTTIISIIITIINFRDIPLLIRILRFIGPPVLFLYIMLIIQNVLVHFLFLQKDEKKKKILAIDNFFGFLNFQYFMVFANCALGFISCLIRILKSCIIGAFIAGRLDISTLSRKFENKDNGFYAYASLITLESVQTNPIMITFIEAVLKPKLNLDAVAIGADDTQVAKHNELIRRKKIIQMKWQVAYTLTRNPQLRFFRLKRAEKKDGSAFETASEMVKLEMLMLAQKRLVEAMNSSKRST